jgi:uncharacterized membrane protein
VTSTVEKSRTVPRWAPPSSLALCLLGLLDAAYLTFEHYTASTTLACSDTGTVNCLKVTTSSYATMAGIPVAVLGLLYFVAMTLLCLPSLWRRPGRTVHRLRLGLATGGVLTVLYLLWVELFRLDAICLWCSGVHLLTFALFAVVLLAQALSPDRGTGSP